MCNESVFSYLEEVTCCVKWFWSNTPRISHLGTSWNQLCRASEGFSCRLLGCCCFCCCFGCCYYYCCCCCCCCCFLVCHSWADWWVDRSCIRRSRFGCCHREYQCRTHRWVWTVVSRVLRRQMSAACPYYCCPDPCCCCCCCCCCWPWDLINRVLKKWYIRGAIRNSNLLIFIKGLVGIVRVIGLEQIYLGCRHLLNGNRPFCSHRRKCS